MTSSSYDVKDNYENTYKNQFGENVKVAEWSLDAVETNTMKLI